MKKYSTLFMLLISLPLMANDQIECPDGTKVVTGNRLYKGKKTTAHGCVDEKGNLHGTTLISYNNIIIDKCNYTNGKLNGSCTSWYFTGEKQRVMQLLNGKPHGETKGWYKNGTLKLQAFYINGKPVGEWKKWNKRGELINVIKH
ncbi:MAG: hypothetical protein OQL20_06225 [Sedimenticola sp.]|nr:hypothetical protein [Sedimenticola sp.]